MVIDPRAIIGRTIKNRYHIHSLIGQGGMGCVYLATDKTMGTACAIKMFLPQSTSERYADTYRRFLERFKREYKIMDDARHPHIIQVYDRGEYSRVAYFVMPFYQHGSLSEKIEALQKIPLPETCQYIRQAASALDYIHAQQMIHRDIKPQNMLIDDQGNLILADFGVAHIAGSFLTLTDQPGTRIYKSPQAKNDWPPDPRDDIYSLGVVLYEMLTGNEPHTSSMYNMGTEVPAVIQPVILKAIAREREDRYASAQELVRDLERAVIQMRKPGKSQTRPARRQSSRQDALRNPLQRGKRDDTLSPLLRLGFLLMVFLALGAASFLLLQRVMAHPDRVTYSFSSVTTVVMTPTPTPQNQATALVKQYYLDWNKQEYQTAYDLLQSAYQQKYSFADLLTSYQHTHHACITTTRTSLQADNSVQVWVADNAIEDAPTGGTAVSLYYVVYDVRQERQSWKLAPISIQWAGNTGICSI